MPPEDPQEESSTARPVSDVCPIGEHIDTPRAGFFING